MARKATRVVSTKIPRGEYEHLLDRVKYLYESKSIRNSTKSSYMKFLINKDLKYDHDRQYQNLINFLDDGLMRGLPGVQSHFPSVLPTIKSRNPSVRIIGADLIPSSE